MLKDFFIRKKKYATLTSPVEHKRIAEKRIAEKRIVKKV